MSTASKSAFNIESKKVNTPNNFLKHFFFLYKAIIFTIRLKLILHNKKWTYSYHIGEHNNKFNNYIYMNWIWNFVVKKNKEDGNDLEAVC